MLPERVPLRKTLVKTNTFCVCRQRIKEFERTDVNLTLL